MRLMPIMNTVCSCCTSGGGDCAFSPYMVCVSVTGCFTDLSGVVIQVTDSHGGTQTCTTNSGGTCTCFSIAWSGTMTITVLSVPARWLMPSPASYTFTSVCGNSVAQGFPLLPNFPDWSCCCPDQTIPIPATLTVTTPLGDLTLTRSGHTYSGCQTVPGVNVGTPTGSILTNCVATTGSTDVLWQATETGLGPGCFTLELIAFTCGSNGFGGCHVPALASNGTCDFSAGGCACVSFTGLTGTCSPVLATGTLTFDATHTDCDGLGNDGSSLLAAIYGMASWTATLSP